MPFEAVRFFVIGIIAFLVVFGNKGKSSLFHPAFVFNYKCILFYFIFG